MSELGTSSAPVSPESPSPTPDHQIPDDALAAMRKQLETGFKSYKDGAIKKLREDISYLNESCVKLQAESDSCLKKSSDKTRELEMLQGKTPESLVDTIRKICSSSFWEYMSYDGVFVKIKTRERIITQEINKAAGINRSVDMGFFEIRLNPITGSIGCFPLKDNVACNWQGGKHYHPFVSPRNEICWGTGKDLSVRLISEKKFDKLFEMLAGLLVSQEIDANPYNALYFFERVRQNQCEGCKYSKEQCACPKCSCCGELEKECECRVCDHCDSKTLQADHCEDCWCEICETESGGDCPCCARCNKTTGCVCRTCTYCGLGINSEQLCEHCECPVCHLESRGTCECCIPCNKRSGEGHLLNRCGRLTICGTCGCPYDEHAFTKCPTGRTRFRRMETPVPAFNPAEATLSLNGQTIFGINAGEVLQEPMSYPEGPSPWRTPSPGIVTLTDPSPFSHTNVLQGLSPLIDDEPGEVEF